MGKNPSVDDIAKHIESDFNKNGTKGPSGKLLLSTSIKKVIPRIKDI